MSSYILRRLLLLIPVLIGVAIIVFGMVRLLPGDPAVAMAGVHATPQYIAQVRAELGLDEPIHVQFGVFVNRLFEGDLGISTRTRRPAAQEIWPRFKNTVYLTAIALFIASLVGITAGVISSVKPYSIYDQIVMLFSLFGVAAPVFWLGLILMLIFSVNLGWFPSSGMGTPLHFVLPAVTLAANSTALIARMTRSSMLEVLKNDYITTARAKGLKEKVIIIKHALRNALIPITTILGLRFGMLLGGAVLTETVFSWPGVGRLMVDSILARDYPVVQGSVLLLALMFVLINLFVDILYAFLDPQISYS
ncbi:ABC transporter permease [Halanaerobium sp. Z-7514]|uniref:ABC transporter permease n=1 Tax=Halanaerobium polyolivorans TaxID=2886943 RepID=A0AAW4X2I7_9FIRM|nr:ABC transporter permease [Halanaerobium polyolivorans]